MADDGRDDGHSPSVLGRSHPILREPDRRPHRLWALDCSPWVTAAVGHAAIIVPEAPTVATQADSRGWHVLRDGPGQLHGTKQQTLPSSAGNARVRRGATRNDCTADRALWHRPGGCIPPTSPELDRDVVTPTEQCERPRERRVAGQLAADVRSASGRRGRETLPPSRRCA